MGRVSPRLCNYEHEFDPGSSKLFFFERKKLVIIFITRLIAIFVHSNFFPQGEDLKALEDENNHWASTATEVFFEIDLRMMPLFLRDSQYKLSGFLSVGRTCRRKARIEKLIILREAATPAAEGTTPDKRVPRTSVSSDDERFPA